MAELEGNAAEDQPEQHQRDRQVKGWQEDRVNHRKGGKQSGTDQDQPASLVAVPVRRDGVHHRDPVLFVARRAEQDADAEVIAVKDHIDQDRKGDDAGPENGKPGGIHRYLPRMAWPPVAVSADPAAAIGRMAVTPVSLASLLVGPSRSSA